MNPRQLILILRSRYKLVVAILFLALIAAGLASAYIPKQYVAETSIMVDIRAPDPISTILQPQAMNAGSLGTQIDIIRSDRVARKVIRMLRLAESSSVKETWLAATQGRGKLEDWMTTGLQKGVIITPSRDSNLITIGFRGTDPEFVAAIVNAFAQAYIEASVELKVEPARQYANWFADQSKALRENVEKAQARVSEFQQKHGIVVTEETMDSELAKLNELSMRLTAAQGESRDAQIKQRPGSGAAETLPEVMQNPVVAGLRTNIGQLEVKLKEAAGNLGVNHPQYRRMESELAELKVRLAAEVRHVASSYTATSGAIGKAKEAELKAAIELQKQKLLGTKNKRDEIAVLLRDVDTAKRAYEAVTNRYHQTSLESQANRTNVSVLTPAVVPVQPSFPKPLEQMLIMALAAGLLLGCAAAYGLELLDRRIRCADDLADMLQLPVLGVIESAMRTPRLGLASAARRLALPAR
jgi:chain length determinant protein EpsF